MKSFFVSTLALLVFCATQAAALVIPGADTPLFYLVSSSGTTSENLMPLRLNGGSGGYSTIAGSGPIGQFYFQSGQLVAKDPAGSPNTYRPNIGSMQTSTATCTTYGQLGFVQGSSSNKCAKYTNFQIQSNTENSQLGAKLVFNYVGGFYSCGDGHDIWYKVASGDGPSGCTPVELYTVPVVA